MVEKNKLVFFGACAFAGAAVGFLVTSHPVGALLGVAIGLVVPGLLDKMRKAQRTHKFSAQLVDTIMMMISCLKAGLSFNQTIEVICREMPAPVSEEFSSILKALRIGVPLEDAFAELSTRMPGEELKLIFSAILVARETGGDLPRVLSKLADTLRDRNRLKENISTYTIQGRVQAVIMGVIPVVFVVVVLQQDPKHFEIMFTTEQGQFMLAIAGVLEVLALFFITKCSAVKI